MPPQKKRYVITGICSICGNEGEVNEHHVYPQRHFGKDRDGNNKNKEIVCKKCHAKLEKEIPHSPKLPKGFYENVVSELKKKFR